MRLYSNEEVIEEYSCYECGSEMKKADDEVLVCQTCGHSVNIDDYLGEEELYEDIFAVHNNIHCINCDGPWPVCTTTCKLFNRD